LLGALVGLAVGVTVELAMGVTVGLAVSVTVGLAVGVTVGLAVGVTVGLVVVQSSTHEVAKANTKLRPYSLAFLVALKYTSNSDVSENDSMKERIF
jgi:hypothetical protein